MKRLMLVLVPVAILTLVFSVSCSKKSDPGEAVVKHMGAMVKIMKDNKDDCDKVIAELTKYTDANKSEFEELKKAGEDMDKNMSEADKKAYADKILAKMGPMMTDIMSVTMELNQKCPDKAQKIGEAMSALK